MQEIFAISTVPPLHQNHGTYRCEQTNWRITQGFGASRTGKVLSGNTLLYAMYRMGYHSQATVHGIRATASTILNESGFKPDVIERQLAHRPANEIRAAYNRADYLPQRHKMLQWWADYLDKIAKP